MICVFHEKMSPGIHVPATLSHLHSVDASGVTSTLEQGHDAQKSKGRANKGTNFMSCCTETKELDLEKCFSVMTPDVRDAGSGRGISGRCRAWRSIPALLSAGLGAIVSDSGIFRCISRYT